MISSDYVALGGGVLALLWAIMTYNRFVALGRRLDEAWSGISVQLRQRRDLIPNLVSTVEGYTGHEDGVLKEITRLRASATAEEGREDQQGLARSEGALSGLLGKVMIIAENYPTLQANESFIALQRSLQDIEENIQMARRYYNGTVRSYNILVESFPSLIIAKIFSFHAKPFFEGDKNDAAVPQVAFSRS